MSRPNLSGSSRAVAADGFSLIEVLIAMGLAGP
jgi:prepilin-type N-terminal cleavage/methylation domain-containing protein